MYWKEEERLERKQINKEIDRKFEKEQQRKLNKKKLKNVYSKIKKLKILFECFLKI